MKEIDPIVLFWVAQEYLGPWLWAALAALAVWAALLILAWRRSPPLRSWRAPLVAGLLTALAAALLAPALTSSSWRLLNGSLDWVSLSLAAIAAGAAAAFGLYPLLRLLRIN